MYIYIYIHRERSVCIYIYIYIYIYISLLRRGPVDQGVQPDVQVDAVEGGQAQDRAGHLGKEAGR